MSAIGQVGLKRVGIKDKGVGLPIYLNRMAPREKYENRLPLYKLCKQGEKTRFVITRFFLTVIIECNTPGKFVLKVRANFGENPPRSAEIRVDKTDNFVTLVNNNMPLQVAGLPFEVPPEKDRVVFLITTKGSNDVSQNFYAILRNIKTDSGGNRKFRAGRG